jgi:molybdopterin/thiamine biosynthesis adenylyltransferase
MLDLTRQSGLIPTEAAQAIRVCIIGAGAIGSHVAEVLCKMGVRHIHIIDYDTVEPHNLPNQGYYLCDVGKTKVEALKERLERGTGAEVTASVEKLSGIKKFDADVLIAAVDSMAVRELIFDCFRASQNCQVLLDGRMGARVAQVHFVDRSPEARARYTKTLISDEETIQEPCTMRSTIFCAYGIASVMGALLAKHLMGETPQKVADMDFSHMIMDRVA